MSTSTQADVPVGRSMRTLPSPVEEQTSVTEARLIFPPPCVADRLNRSCRRRHPVTPLYSVPRAGPHRSASPLLPSSRHRSVAGQRIPVHRTPLASWNQHKNRYLSRRTALLVGILSAAIDQRRLGSRHNRWCGVASEDRKPRSRTVAPLAASILCVCWCLIALLMGFQERTVERAAIQGAVESAARDKPRKETFPTSAPYNTHQACDPLPFPLASPTLVLRSQIAFTSLLYLAISFSTLNFNCVSGHSSTPCTPMR